MVVETSVGVVKAQPDVIGGQDFFALPCVMQTVLQVSRLSRPWESLVYSIMTRCVEVRREATILTWAVTQPR